MNLIDGEKPSNSLVIDFESIRSGRNVYLAFIVLTIPFCVFASLSAIGLTKHWSSLYKFAATWIVLNNSFVNGLVYIVIFHMFDLSQMCKFW